MMTVETRKPAIARCKVFPLDSHNGIGTYFDVYSDTGNHYQVAIPERPKRVQYQTRTKQRIMYFQYKPVCREWHPTEALQYCKENANGTVCKHSLAAIEHRVRVARKSLSLPKNGERASAVKLLNFGGQLIKITNQNGKSVWGVVRK